MLYCDYDTYAAAGGTMTAEQFAIWAPRASGCIDRLTLGRAKRYAKDEAIAPQLADACARIVDIMANAANAAARGAGLVSAATTDGYSETFIDAAQLHRRMYADAMYALRDALGADEQNLLYGGVCGCSNLAIL